MATLLTGVGYIGLALVRRLQQRGERVVGLESFYSTPRAALPADLPIVEGDVAEPADVARAFDALAGCGRGGRGSNDEPLVVYHLAAQPSAAMAARDPATTERTNLTGARIVLEAARDRGARVIFGGSFRVYGDALNAQTVDEQTPYGRVGDLSHLSKIYVEQLARMIGVPFASVRLGVTYGLSPIMKTTPAFMTVPNLFCQRAATGEVLQVLEDRPMAFIHVGDAADALLAAARLGGETWQVVNAAPEVATIGQLARSVQRLAQDRHARVRIQGAASSEAGFRVSSRLPLEYQHTLMDGLGEVLDFFVARR